MSRLPLRVKLTLAFAGVMAIVLSLTGFVVAQRFGLELDRILDDGLRSRADDVTALVRQSDTGLGESGGTQLTEEGESFAQVLDTDGRVVDATPPLGDRPVLTRAELTEAARGATFVERRTLPGLDDPSRLLATPVEAQDQQLVVVVGSSVEDRDEALNALAVILFAGGAGALLLASLAGYAVAAAALRPVESMRRQAAAISAAERGRRLPVPNSRDELARLAETLNDMLARLEVALERERSFVADASHELRTPLAILKAELDLASRSGRSEEELREAVASAAEETDRLARLAEDLLVIAHSDQGRLPVQLEPVAVREMFTAVAERFERRSRDANRRLLVNAPDALAVDADRRRVEQALGNLIDNALRHGDGAVRVSAKERDGRVELHVSDEGPGFPDSFIDSAFERFTRTDEGRSGGGTGLGLAIVASIASAHGGEAVAANLGKGGADVWFDVAKRR